MLHQRYPDVLDWGSYLEGYSPYRRFQTYTWGNGPGHPQPEKQDKLGQLSKPACWPFLGPGQYKTPTNLPLNDHHEQNIQVKGHCKRDAVYDFPTDTRFSKDGIIKGLVQRTSNPNTNGPGKYSLPEAKYGAAGFTFPKAKETPDKIRAKSVATAVPPPGTYEVRGIFDPSSDEEDEPPMHHNKSKSSSKSSSRRNSRTAQGNGGKGGAGDKNLGAEKDGGSENGAKVKISEETTP